MISRFVTGGKRSNSSRKYILLVSINGGVNLVVCLRLMTLISVIWVKGSIRRSGIFEILYVCSSPNWQFSTYTNPQFFLVFSECHDRFPAFDFSIIHQLDSQFAYNDFKYSETYFVYCKIIYYLYMKNGFTFFFSFTISIADAWISPVALNTIL